MQVVRTDYYAIIGGQCYNSVTLIVWVYPSQFDKQNIIIYICNKNKAIIINGFLSSRPTEVELNRFYRISIVLTEITSGDARSQRVSGECRYMATKILELHTATYPQISYIPIWWHRWRTDRRMDGRSETNIPPTTSFCGGYDNTTVEEWVCCNSLLCVNPGCKSRQLCNIPRRVLQFSYVDGLRNILYNVILKNINKATYING